MWKGSPRDKVAEAMKHVTTEVVIIIGHVVIIMVKGLLFIKYAQFKPQVRWASRRNVETPVDSLALIFTNFI